jgi:hypothetical protein
LFLTNLTRADALIIGASSADFEAGNTQITLDVRDTSSAKSSGEGNKFSNVQVSANGYFLADNKTHIEKLAIWGKASVEITRESSAGHGRPNYVCRV